MRRSPFLLALALIMLHGGSAFAGQPRQLAADLRRLLAICHMSAAERDGALVLKAGWQDGPNGTLHLRGAYGRIAVATGDQRCALDFDLAAGSMTDVVRIVDGWVRAKDKGATFRDPRSDGGTKAIWALRHSTVKLDLAAGPTRGRLIVTDFPSRR